MLKIVHEGLKNQPLRTLELNLNSSTMIPILFSDCQKLLMFEILELCRCYVSRLHLVIEKAFTVEACK